MKVLNGKKTQKIWAGWAIIEKKVVTLQAEIKIR